MGFSNHCCNIHGPLFFFSKAKKKNQKQGLDANPNLSRHQSCRTTSNKNKKTKERMQNIAFRTNLHHVILLSFPSSAFRPVRGGEKKRAAAAFQPTALSLFLQQQNVFKEGFFFLFAACATAAKSKKLKAKARKKQKTGAACSEGICDYH